MAAPDRIFLAREIITVDPEVPRATAVAVSDGRIVAAGSPEDMRAALPGAVVDETFGDCVILPGFVEAHSHQYEGAIWEWEYVGYFPRPSPDGTIRPGCRTFEELIATLRRLDSELADPSASLVVWGFDPIYFPGERLAARHLDVVSETRPIVVLHASLHLVTVNTALLRREGIADGLRPGMHAEGIPVDGSGRPTGELQEIAAYTVPRQEIRRLTALSKDPAGTRRFANMARSVGCTTVSDIGTVLNNDADVDAWLRAGAQEGFPARTVPFYAAGRSTAGSAAESAEWAASLSARSTDMVRLGLVKIVLDGSIQGYTARLNPPGYLPNPDGTPRDNGLWLMSPEQFAEMFGAYHRAGLTVHTHVNGDEATDLLIDTVADVLAADPRHDHRHTAQHSQLTTPAQYARMAALGMSANIFVNHIYYWGDQHASLTVGPDRAARMDACASADAAGVRYSIHCDASVTPLGCLRTMWSAVNRVTASGVVLGAGERIDPWRALRAVTIDAAHQMRLDHEIGSITPGKLADFVALSDSPLSVDPMSIRDIGVRGTVLGGTVTSPVAP